MTDLTFARLLTPEGIIAAATLTTSLVALLKWLFPVLDAQVSGARMAFFFTAALYAIAGIAIPLGTPDAALALFIAWLSCATAAVGIHATAKHIVAGPPAAIDAAAVASAVDRQLYDKSSRIPPAGPAA
jgi:hypothetical protein